MLALPAIPVVDRRFRITLEDGGSEYFIRLVYRERSRRWYLYLYDTNRVAIVAGLRIVAGYGLLRRIVDARRPPGDLYCFDGSSSGGASEWDMADLGTRARLYYMTRAEIDALVPEADPEDTVVVS